MTITQKQLDEMKDRLEHGTKEERERKAEERAHLDALGARFKAEREAKEQTKRDKIQAAQTERATVQAQAQAEQAKNRARAAWALNGGAPSAFEAAWPKIHEQALIAQAAVAVGDRQPVRVSI